MFNDFADIADDVYNTMPPPVPSRADNEKEVAVEKAAEPIPVAISQA